MVLYYYEHFRMTGAGDALGKGEQNRDIRATNPCDRVTVVADSKNPQPCLQCIQCSHRLALWMGL